MATKNIVNRAPGITNVGGISEIVFIPVEYLGSLPMKGSIDLKAVVPSEDFEFEDWRIAEFVQETAKYTEERAQGPNGPYVKIKVSWKVAKHVDDRVALFTDMREREFAVAVLDTNRVGRFIGEINLRGERKGAQFFEAGTSGEKFADRNEYDCFFYAECANKARPCYYTGARIGTLDDDVVISTE